MRLGTKSGIFVLSLILAMSVLSRVSHAATKRVQEVGLGLAAGATTGLGVTTRLRLNRGFAVGITGMPFFAELQRGFSLGVQGTLDLYTDRGISLYGLVGTQAFVSRVYYVEPFRQDRVRRRYDTLVAGSGVGAQFRRGRFALNVELAVAGIFALTPSTHLRYRGRVNVGFFPNLAFCVFLGKQD